MKRLMVALMGLSMLVQINAADAGAGAGAGRCARARAAVTPRRVCMLTAAFAACTVGVGVLVAREQAREQAWIADVVAVHRMAWREAAEAAEVAEAAEAANVPFYLRDDRFYDELVDTIKKRIQELGGAVIMDEPEYFVLSGGSHISSEDSEAIQKATMLLRDLRQEKRQHDAEVAARRIKDAKKERHGGRYKRGR